MSIDYAKIMSELDKYLGLEEVPKAKQVVSKTNSFGKSKKAFESYDEVEKELASQLGENLEEVQSDDLVFEEDDKELTPEEILTENIETYINSYPDMEPAEISEKIKSLVDEVISLEGETEVETDSATESTEDGELKEAYNWFNKTFEEWFDSKNCEPSPEDWDEFRGIIKEAPYNTEMLAWIWDEVAEDDDYDGSRSFEEFYSLSGGWTGSYPEEKWKQMNPDWEDDFDYEKAIEDERLSITKKDSATESTEEGETIVNGYVIGKNQNGYTVYNNEGHFEDEEHKAGYKTVNEAKKRALSLKKGIAIDEDEIEKEKEKESGSSFESLSAKMISRYKTLAKNPRKKTSNATAEEGLSKNKIALDENAIARTSAEFGYSGNHLRKIVTEAIEKGVI